MAHESNVCNIYSYNDDFKDIRMDAESAAQLRQTAMFLMKQEEKMRDWMIVK